MGDLTMAGIKEGPTVWSRLFRASEELQMLHEKQTRITTPLHATFAQLRILSYIRFSPGESVKIKEIADELEITPAAASQIVERMVQAGIVERSVVPGDRRSVRVTLSSEGRDCYAQSDKVFEKLMTKLLKDVPQEKIIIFQEVMDSLLKAISSEKESLIEKK